MVYFLVGIAGALGAILRYLIGISLFTHSVFPFTTLLINLIGCFVLAWFTTNIFNRISISPEVKTAITTGFVGSFTTFSTVSVETIDLFRNELVIFGMLYILISIVGGIFMCQLGFKVSAEEQPS